MFWFSFSSTSAISDWLKSLMLHLLSPGNHHIFRYLINECNHCIHIFSENMHTLINSRHCASSVLLCKPPGSYETALCKTAISISEVKGFPPLAGGWFLKVHQCHCFPLRRDFQRALKLYQGMRFHVDTAPRPRVMIMMLSVKPDGNNKLPAL